MQLCQLTMLPRIGKDRHAIVPTYYAMPCMGKKNILQVYTKIKYFILISIIKQCFIQLNLVEITATNSSSNTQGIISCFLSKQSHLNAQTSHPHLKCMNSSTFHHMQALYSSTVACKPSTSSIYSNKQLNWNITRQYNNTSTLYLPLGLLSFI